MLVKNQALRSTKIFSGSQDASLSELPLQEAMACKTGVWVYLQRGLGGDLYDHYSEQGFVGTRCNVVAEPEDLISIRIHIAGSFKWYDANALLLEVFLDSKNPLIPLQIPRDPNSKTITIGIPHWPVYAGNQRHGATGRWGNASFWFRNVHNSEVSSAIFLEHRT